MPIPSWLAIVGLLLWVAYEVVLRRRTDRDAASWQGGDSDRSSTLLLMTAYGAAIVMVIGLDAVGVGGLPVGLRWVGVAMLAGGLGLRAWAMRVLGRFYTRTLRVVGDQQVVASGPYRLIRHPGYTGSLLVWTGYCLGIGNWIALLVVTALMLAAYGWRIRSEERMLVDSLGEEYRRYQRRTARLLPFVY
jgi:protein-S-isoprenylcysteine O-methyltransferase Ste14